MKEHPIIMSGNHPRLILEGRKIMTRRTWGLEGINKDPNKYKLHAGQDHLQRFFTFYSGQGEPLKFAECPYGQVGDRLRVNETWRICGKDNNPSCLRLEVQYKTDMVRRWIEVSKEIFAKYEYGEFGWSVDSKWRSSRFMPRWASRILLEITGVRAERLQEITMSDCKAEGIKRHISSFAGMSEERNLIYSFHLLWDSLNAKRGFGWETNCWVWVITYKAI